MKTLIIRPLAGTLAFLLPLAALAQTPPDLTDLIGARGSSGETQLQARGYQFVRTNKTNGMAWSFWWNDDRNTCVSVSTVDGRYASLQEVPAANCRASSARSSRYDDDTYRDADTFTLTCYGEGSHQTSQPHVSTGYNVDEKKTESSVRMETEQEQFRTTVMLEVGPQGGRIKLEGKMVPPMHSDDTDGWRTLADYRIDDNVISGMYKMNFASKPTIRVDRRSGILTIKGTQSFSGQCEKSNGGRKF